MTTICSCMENLEDEVLKDFIEVCEPILDSLASMEQESLDAEYYKHLSMLEREAMKVFQSRQSVSLIDFHKYEND